MEQIFMLLASIFAGMCAASVVLLIAEMISAIDVEKAQFGEDARHIPVFFRIFLPFTPNFRRICASEALSGTMKKLREQLAMAGYEQALTAEQFMTVRILMGVLGVLFTVLFFASNNAMAGLLVLFCMVFYPQVWLRGLVARRHLQILKALPNVLDLLTLSVEAGKDFVTALRDILNRRPADELGLELRKALHEIQLGKPRHAALKEMTQRVRQPELTSVLNAIIQSDELGVSIGQVLRIQAEQLRAKRY
ncbi:MAG: type II secretion system F family protein, partial [Firmicutes bacterium]|nr:type II secretion system F family protein [Bacillota bacterium]